MSVSFSQFLLRAKLFACMNSHKTIGAIFCGIFVLEIFEAEQFASILTDVFLGLDIWRYSIFRLID